MAWEGNAYALGWAWDQRCEHSGQKLLLVCLAWTCDHPSGHARATQAELAKLCQLTRRQVATLLADLERLGLVHVDHLARNRVHRRVPYLDVE